MELAREIGETMYEILLVLSKILYIVSPISLASSMRAVPLFWGAEMLKLNYYQVP